MTARRGHLRVVPAEPAATLPVVVTAAAAMQGPVERLALPVTAGEATGTFQVTLLASFAMHGMVLALAGWFLFGEVEVPVPLLDLVVVMGEDASSSGDPAAHGGATSAEAVAVTQTEPQAAAPLPAEQTPAEPLQPAAAPRAMTTPNPPEAGELPPVALETPQPSAARALPLTAAMPAPQEPTMLQPVQPAPDAVPMRPVPEQAPPPSPRELRPPPRQAPPARPAPPLQRETRPAAPQAPPGEAAPASPPAASIAPSGGGPAGSGDTGATLVGQIKPVYPAGARARGAEGKVMVSLLVGADGRVHRADIRSSSGHPDLDAAAREAVLKWTFRPARRGGAAVPYELTAPVTFALHR